MMSFELEESHAVLGALEKRYVRTYLFKNLPGLGEADKHDPVAEGPRLIVYDKDKVVREHAGDELGRVRRLGERAFKLTFTDERASNGAGGGSATAKRLMMGKRTVSVRTVRFRGTSNTLPQEFLLACRKLNPNVEIELKDTPDGDAATLSGGSDIESKSSLDNMSSILRDSDGGTRSGRSPHGSFDNTLSENPIFSGGEPTLVEQLGSGLLGTSDAGSQGRFEGAGGADDEELMGGLRVPLASPATLALSQTQSYGDFQREICSWPKYFCRIRNRYGMMEGKMIALGTDEIRFVSLVEDVVVQDAAGGSEIDKKDTKEMGGDEPEADEVVQMSSILSSLPPPISAPSSSTLETASTATGSTAGVATSLIKQEFAFFWSVSKARISKLVFYGVYGAHLILKLDDGIEMDVQFETPGARNHFASAVFGNPRDARIVQLFPGGEDAAAADLQGASVDFSLIALKGMGSVRAARFFVLNRTDRCVWIFRNADLIGNIVSESCMPFRSIVIPTSGLHVEHVRSSRIRLKWGFSHSQTVASAPSSSSIVPGVKNDGSEKSHFDLLFPNYFERERFAAHLFSMASPLRIIAPPSQLRTKYQRVAWHRPHLSWFEVKRSLFLGTFNVSDAPPPDPAMLDLWVAHPIKMKRDMVTGGLKTSARTRAKSGSAGVTGRFSVYVFGLQECGNKFDDWTKALQNHLGSEYGLVSSARLWEIGLLVFASLAEADKISCVETNSVATGRGIAKEVTGMQLGNKGGVAIGLKWRDTSLCFVNAHLAPHQEKSAIRNQNFQQIMNKLGLSGNAGDCGDIGFEPTHAFEHVFFFGDLNYRVDETFQKVVSIASQGKWPVLHAMDQLKREMESGRAYYGFREAGVPHFPPTYRWERNKRAFSNKRDQPPSYTDRILVSSRRGLESKVTSTLYGSSQDIMISDHRPVAATFTLSIREPYTPWPLHPLTCELSKRDLAGDDASGKEGGELGLASSSLFQPFPLLMGREASSSGSAPDLSLAPTSEANESRPSSFGSRTQQAFLPLYQLTSSTAFNGAQVATPQDREEEIRDQDEEDDPEQFLGAFGSFFITPESFVKETGSLPPEMRLSKLVLKLDKREGASLPPAFVQMRVASRILQEVENLEPVPGMEDLAKNEYAFNYESGKTWGDLYYQWNLPAGGENEMQQAQPQVAVLKPTVWDPCYLCTQQLLIAVEEISSSKKKEEAKKKVSVMDDEEGVADSPPAGRKTLGGGGTGSSGVDAASRISARLSRRKRSVGTTAMQIGSAIVGAAAGSHVAPSLVGQVSLNLKDIIEDIRKMIAKDAGLTRWSRSQPFSVDFSEPVVFSGVCVGTLKGTLSLVPGGGKEERTAFETMKTAVVGRTGARHLEPVYCMRSYDVEVQLEGFADKKGSGWRRVFAALDTSGTLFLCPKAPGGNKSGQALLDALTRTALLVLDVSEGALDYAVGSATAADRACTFELTAKRVSSTAQDTMASKPMAVVVFSVKDESDRKLWGTCIQSLQATKRYEAQLQKEIARDCDGRKEQRARRLEIERKRRLDQEAAALLAQQQQQLQQQAMAQHPPLARNVSFDEAPPQVVEPSSHKSSFLSRALLMSAKKSLGKSAGGSGGGDDSTNARGESGSAATGGSNGGQPSSPGLHAKPSFRERWFGGRGGDSDSPVPSEDDKSPSPKKRSAAHSAGARSAAHSSYGGAGSVDVLSDAMVDALSLDPTAPSATNAAEKTASSPKPNEEADDADREDDTDADDKSPSASTIAQRLRERAKNNKLKVKRAPTGKSGVLDT